MAERPRDPQKNPEKGPSEAGPSPGELVKTSAPAGETLANQNVKPVNKIDFLLAPMVPGDLGSLGGFRIIKILGEGGMGLVFLAEDLSLNRKLAIKVVLPTYANQTTKERFFREARATAALHHDNVISIFMVGEDNGVPFLAMPFLQGMPLDKYLEEHKKLSVKEALRITVEALAGLSSAHSRNMVHRDIKPSNIWLEGSRKKVILLDFGLAKGGEYEETTLTKVGSIMGTPAYMSPEQARAKEVDRRSDLFSMGVVFYEMLTGEAPFKAKTVMGTLANLMSQQPKFPSEIDPNIPQEISNICMWMLEKDPEMRPRSAREAAARIQAFEKGGEKEVSAKVDAKSDVAKTDLIRLKRTVEAPWKPKRIEEIERLYPQPPKKAPEKVLTQKEKRKKNSLAPIIFSMVGVFIIIMVGLIITFNQKSRSVHKEEKQFTSEEKKFTKNPVLEEGFVPLFPTDGVPEGWENKALRNLEIELIPNPWKVTNGELVAMPGGSGWLLSKKEYGDFVFKFEYQLGEDSISSVVLGYDKTRQNAESITFQLLGAMESDRRALAHTTGAIWNLIAAKNRVIVNRDWNTAWFKVEGSRVDAKVNDRVVIEVDFSAPPEKGNPVIPDQLKDFKNGPLRGRIGLCSWDTVGEPIIFRKVQIKELNQTKSTSSQRSYEVAAAIGYSTINKLIELTGAKGYWQWDGAGEVNQSKKGQSLPPNEFGIVAERAFMQAPKIHFDLVNMPNPANFVELGRDKGWATGNLTNAQLHLIVSRPDLLRKTVFYKNGVPVPNPFTN